MSEKLTVPLYRIENPNIIADPNGLTSKEVLKGQWFSTNLDTATIRLQRATSTFSESGRRVVDGVRLVIADVPEDQLGTFHVDNIPEAQGMDTEVDNYLLPRDGSIPMHEIPLDDALSELRGKMGNILNLSEGRRRIGELVVAHETS